MTERFFPVRKLGLRERLRREVGAAITDGFFGGAARSGRLVPLAHPRLHGVRVERNVPYRRTGRDAHLLDVYRPTSEALGLRPCVFYIHGGAFRVLSKDTHWIFGLVYARRGFVVVNVNYQLAPERPFPAAIEDVSAAWQWLVENAGRLGVDLGRVVVAGESAGANLAMGLTVATSMKRDEGFARDVFGTQIVPKAVVAACGIFETSRPERFSSSHAFFRDRFEELTDAYLGNQRLGERLLDFADPIRPIERGDAQARPLPPVFLPCGKWDHLIVDSRRMHAALTNAGSVSRLGEYDRGPHAFHAFVVTPSARACWRDTWSFLRDHSAMP